MSRHYNDMTNLGLDAPNVDHATGIRVGFISQHSVQSEALDDITSGDDVNYEAAVDEAKAKLRNALHGALDELGLLPSSYDSTACEQAGNRLTEVVDGVWESVEQDFNDDFESDNASYRYEQEGYVIEWTPNSAMACVAVVRSKFYTLCAFGSPCIPNAGDLDTPGDVKTYCLGTDWFEDDKAPYNVYEVETGTLVYEVPKEGEASA